ncbi:DUF4870 domain-containing protein [Ktedonospora formicarum]|uniref:Uncharacterized protein n=1 Tax=Ktedonospora formicarum TaxID=2778364 RepID=A0A8J3MVD3_9CHLR|nr:hypothetical protein [Ktedonospora formicarum]GHO50172.1 hypothetical protein KSX_83350 [Ktedonospora formicarum]
MSWEKIPPQASVQAQYFYESGYSGAAEGALNQEYAEPTMHTTNFASGVPGSEQVMPPPQQAPQGGSGYVLYGWQPLFMRVGESNSSRMAAALSYFVGWFSGLVLLFFGFQNKYVRFHALQSLLFFGFINLADVIMFLTGDLGSHIYGRIPHLDGFFILGLMLAFFLLNSLAFVGWLVCMIMAANGKTYKLPFFGSMAAHLSGHDGTPQPAVK